MFPFREEINLVDMVCPFRTHVFRSLKLGFAVSEPPASGKLWDAACHLWLMMGDVSGPPRRENRVEGQCLGTPAVRCSRAEGLSSV